MRASPAAVASTPEVESARFRLHDAALRALKAAADQSPLVVILGISFAGTYNRLVTLGQDVDKSWAEVENQYQRRADLIPNLVATVKGEANFEQSTLEAVIQARAKATSIQAGRPRRGSATIGRTSSFAVVGCTVRGSPSPPRTAIS